MRAELQVTSTRTGIHTIENDLVWSEEISLSDLRNREEVAKALGARLHLNPVETRLLLDNLSAKVRQAERAGEPAVLLRDIPRPTADDTLTVEGLTLLKNHPMLIFGDGGTAKSYLALYVAGLLDRQGLKVGLFDWELGGGDHRLRLERLFGPDNMPGVYYARCSYPLSHDTDRIEGIIKEHRLDYAIFDSVAFACDGQPESAEVAGNYLRSLRPLNVGSLHLAHVTKAGAESDKPFGSAFWHNGARSTWFVMRTVGESSDRQIIRLKNCKANLGPLLPDVGFEILFEPERTTFTKLSAGALSAIASKDTAIKRIRKALAAGPLSVGALVNETGDQRGTVTKTVNRYVKSGELERIPGSHGESELIAFAEALRKAA